MGLFADIVDFAVLVFDLELSSWRILGAKRRPYFLLVMLVLMTMRTLTYLAADEV